MNLGCKNRCVLEIWRAGDLEILILVTKCCVPRESWTLDDGSKILSPGSWIQDPGNLIQEPGSWTLDPGSKILSPGSKSLDLESRIQAPFPWWNEFGMEVCVCFRNLRGW